MNSKTLVMVSAMVMLIVVSGCSRHIQEPWVPDPGYLKSERSRSADLNETLDHRALHQNDR